VILFYFQELVKVMIELREQQEEDAISKETILVQPCGLSHHHLRGPEAERAESF
jgi:hypothetical protein